MATRRYTRRTRLSQSVERPVGSSPQVNSDVPDGDTPVLAPFTAAAGPSAPSTPVQMLDMDTSQNNADTQALDRALAASLTSPVRKQRRVVHDDAPPDLRQQELGNSSAAAVRTATPRPPAGSAGAGDDATAEPCCSMFQRMLGDARGAPPSYKDADTEDLTAELIRRARQVEPITEEEHRRRQRERGLQAYDAICEIARELQGSTVPPGTKPAPRLTSELPATDAFNTITDVARELRSPAPPAVYPPASRSSDAPAASSNSRATSSTSEPKCVNAPAGSTGALSSAASVPTFCRGKLPRLIFADDSEPESRRDDVNDTARMPVPTFDGKNWAAFKSVFESVAKHYRWSDEIKALRLKCCIKGDARAALGVVESIDWTYAQLVEHMELRHGRHKSKTEVMNELDKLYRKPGQSLTQWRDEVISVANTGALTDAQWKQYTHYSFLKGLGTYGQMQSWVGEHDKEETLASCYESAKRYEREVGVPTYSARPPVKIAAHTATTATMAVDMVTPVDTTAPAPTNVRQVEAAPSENLADALASIQQQLKKIGKSTYRGGRGGRGGKGGRGGWRFGNQNNNNNQSGNGGNSDQRQEGDSRKAQSAAKSE